MPVDKNMAAVPPDQSISIVEEQLNVEKKVVDRASIRLNKKVEEKTVEVPLTTRTHGYSVRRTSLSEYVDEAPPAIRYEGDTIVISVVEEELVMVTRLKVVEEIRLIPFVNEETKTEQIALKKESVTIEKDPSIVDSEKN